MSLDFFSESELDSYQESSPLLPDCGACGLYKDCQSPKMEPTGQGKARILIVAEAPGENEDIRGVQLVGNSGQRIMGILSQIGIHMRRDCWLTNSVICRPIDEKGFNRTPTSKELNWCRPNLKGTIEELKPNVIIPLGLPATKSVIALAYKGQNTSQNAKGKHGKDTMGKWVGWQIPSVRLNAWICPTFHPSFLLREERESRTCTFHATKHLMAACSHSRKPWKQTPDWDNHVTVEFHPGHAAEMIDDFRTRKEMIAFDYETTTLKPDGPHAKILCCSVSDGKTSIAFPWVAKTRAAMKELIRSSVPKVGANIKFEERWTWKEFKHGVRKWEHDTMLGAHWLNCHSGICGLKFQAFVTLGIEDYSHSVEKYMKPVKPGDNNPNRLHEVEPAVLLRYCALDSLFEMLVAQKQRKEGKL